MLLGVLTMYYECTVVHILNIVLIKQSIIKYSLITKMNQLNRQVDIKHPQPDERHPHFSRSVCYARQARQLAISHPIAKDTLLVHNQLYCSHSGRRRDKKAFWYSLPSKPTESLKRQRAQLYKYLCNRFMTVWWSCRNIESWVWLCINIHLSNEKTRNAR